MSQRIYFIALFGNIFYEAIRRAIFHWHTRPKVL